MKLVLRDHKQVTSNELISAVGKLFTYFFQCYLKHKADNILLFIIYFFLLLTHPMKRPKQLMNCSD